MIKNSLVLFTILVAGCGVKPEADDDLSILAPELTPESEALKADLPTSVKVVGTLSYGQTSASTRYTSTPKYRAFKFIAKAGDQVDAWVRGSTGDAVGWIVDGNGYTVVYNDDATSSTLDSRLTTTIKTAGTYYVVFRDYYSETRYFTVKLDGKSAAPADCRTSGCGTGNYCSYCWGGWVCLPNNAIC